MIVYSNFNVADYAKEYSETLQKFIPPMLGYFQNFNYGDEIKEIAFNIISVEPEQKKYHGIGKTFRRKKKSIGCSLEIPIETVNRLPKENVIDITSSAFLKAIDEFKTFKIKNFDLSAFQKDFEEFLLKSKREVLLGRVLVVEPLNDEVILEINKKFENL